MTFSFNYPLVLLFIPAAAVFVMYTSKKMAGLVRWRKRLIAALRVSVLILLIICIAGPGIKKTSDNSTTIFLFDSSDSTAKLKAVMENFIKDALKTKKASEKVGIINFGANASVEFTPTDRPGFSSVQTKINSNFTNMEQGLKLASSLIPGGDRKRIVLLSDGEENTGDGLKQARLLKQQNITVDVYQVKKQSLDDIQVKEIIVPENLRIKEQFEIVVKLDSTVRTGAVLKLYADRELISEKNIEIQLGENNFAFADVAKKGGMITYSAVIDPVEDTITKNNKLSAFSYVEDMAKVLVIQDVDQAASEIVKILGNDVDVKAIQPENAPVSVEELQKYDAFIISDVSAERLSDKFLNSMEICIKHQGKGLLVTGGENSYAPGGYYKTHLEKVLPVNMDIKPKEELPNLGLVLVIDKSGSMTEGQYGISKVELAKEAAIRSTEVLRKEDMVGVIAFDDAVQWVVKTQKLDNLSKIQDSIGTIRGGGGTQIINPLVEAYNSLKNADTKLKHIILLTDGQAEKSGYDTLIQNLNEAGITLSTVGVGQMADTQLLSSLASGGKGRFYMTDEFSDIPKIFTKETFLAGKTYLNNRTFTPNLKSYSDILRGIEAVPTLDGYVGTSPKSTAKVIFSSDRDDPVLATWQYGLGRTVAWTSDAKGIWTSEWQAWNQSPRFWKNLVSWILQKRTNDAYSIKGSLSSGNAVIELTLPPDDQNLGGKVDAVVVSPSGLEQTISLDPVNPGLYRGSFNSGETGVYVTNISIKKSGQTVKTISSGIAIPYSPEYDISRKDTSAYMQKLAFEGGGRVLRNAGDVFSGKLPPVVNITDMTPILLVLVIILFMLDIAARRLNINPKKVELAFVNAAEISMDRVSKTIRPIIQNIGKLKKIAKKPQTHKELNSDVQSPAEARNAVKEKLQALERRKTDSSHISTLLEKKKRREK